jgi:hypothetical protein
MTFLSFSLVFGFLAVLYGVSDSRFKLCDFVVNGLIKGEIEKPSGQFLGLIVIVIDLARFEFESGTFWLFYLYSLFHWRIMFACLMVCRWHMQHAVQQ